MRIIYNEQDGRILYTCMDAAQVPRVLDVEVPQGKILMGIDVSGDTPTPIFGDPEVHSDLREDNKKLKEEVTQLELGLTELTELVAPLLQKE